MKYSQPHDIEVHAAPDTARRKDFSASEDWEDGQLVKVWSVHYRWGDSGKPPVIDGVRVEIKLNGARDTITKSLGYDEVSRMGGWTEAIKAFEPEHHTV